MADERVVEIERDLTRTTYCDAFGISWLPATNPETVGRFGEGWGDLVVAYHIEPIRRTSIYDGPVGGAVRLDFREVHFFSWAGHVVNEVSVVTAFPGFCLSQIENSKLIDDLTGGERAVPPDWNGALKPEPGPALAHYAIAADEHGALHVAAAHFEIRRFQWLADERTVLEQALALHGDAAE